MKAHSRTSKTIQNVYAGQGTTLTRYRSATADIIIDIGGGGVAIAPINLSRRRLELFSISVGVCSHGGSFESSCCPSNELNLNFLYRIQWCGHEIQIRISCVRFQANNNELDGKRYLTWTAECCYPLQQEQHVCSCFQSSLPKTEQQQEVQHSRCSFKISAATVLRNMRELVVAFWFELLIPIPLGTEKQTGRSGILLRRQPQ